MSVGIKVDLIKEKENSNNLNRHMIHIHWHLITSIALDIVYKYYT